MHLQALLVLFAACGAPVAAPTPDVPVNAPEPAQPAPAPPPPEVVEADGRCTWYGVSFPLTGGELTNCSARAVSTHHGQGKPADLLVSYAKALEGAGFLRVEPADDPTFKRGELTVQLTTYKSTDDPGVDVIAMRR
jgi:hypothetical protein